MQGLEEWIIGPDWEVFKFARVSYIEALRAGKDCSGY